MAFELPKLSYAYDALEPYIDRQTMELHHSKHHNTYLTNLNDAVKGTDLESLTVEQILAKGVANISGKVRNHGGGYANHNLFWATMKPNGGGEAKGPVGEAITKTFGAFGAFREKFTDAAKTQFGSGWAWLVLNQGNLEVYSAPNQDSPIMDGKTPLLGLDVWEHAYYLKYQNRRPDYIEAWWNLVNWDHVNELYTAAKK